MLVHWIEDALSNLLAKHKTAILTSGDQLRDAMRGILRWLEISGGQCGEPRSRLWRQEGTAGATVGVETFENGEAKEEENSMADCAGGAVSKVMQRCQRRGDYWRHQRMAARTAGGR